MTNDAFWESVEVESWSRGFDYTNYKTLHKRIGGKSHGLDEKGYKQLCFCLDGQMERDMNNGKAF